MIGAFVKRLKYTAAAFIDYSLPTYTFVKFTEIGTRRFDEDGNYQRKTSASNGPTRDVEMIYTTLAYLEKDPATGEMKPRVFGDGTEEKFKFTLVNEDTGFGWPPYFKFDTADLQGSAAGLRGQYGWVESFGWRNQFFSWFHNALGVVKYEPGMTVTNYARIVATTLWALGILLAGYAAHRLTKSLQRRVEQAAQAAREQAGVLGTQVADVSGRVEAFRNAEGVVTARRRFWKIFGDWW